MTIYTNQQALFAHVEASYGAGRGGSWLATDAISTINVLDWQQEQVRVPRDLQRHFWGGSRELIAYNFVTANPQVELSSAAAAGTPPNYAAFLRMCGLAQTIDPGVKVEYTPVSFGTESGVLLYRRGYQDTDLAYVTRGVRGTCNFEIMAGDRPKVNFTLRGIDREPWESAWVRPNYDDLVPPLVVNSANASELRLGCSYNATTGKISGGTAYPTRGITVDLGMAVEDVLLIGSEQIDYSQRSVTGEITLALTGAQDRALYSDTRAGGLTSLGWKIQIATGRDLTIFAPSVQLMDPRPEDYAGRTLTRLAFKALPTGANGNNELRLVYS